MNDYLKKIEELAKKIDQAEAICIGAGAGLSASAGFTYDGERFDENFSNFKEKYGITDMYSGGFYPFKTPEEKWAFWSRLVYINRYDQDKNPVFQNLYALVKDKNFFVITTNVDHLFQLNGFPKDKLFYTQGDYGLFQCSVPCHKQTYNNERIIKKMLKEQKDLKIPSYLVPHCPKCGAEMSMNLRADSTFVEDPGWFEAANRYEKFLQENVTKKILFLDLGIGGNTPSIIKYPFWRMTLQNPKATYACINLYEAICPEQIRSRSILIDSDIGEAIKDTLQVKEDLKKVEQ